jgi:hypothetical protein
MEEFGKVKQNCPERQNIATPAESFDNRRFFPLGGKSCDVDGSIFPLSK